MSITLLITSICLKSMYWRSKIGSTPHELFGVWSISDILPVERSCGFCGYTCLDFQNCQRVVGLEFRFFSRRVVGAVRLNSLMGPIH